MKIACFYSQVFFKTPLNAYPDQLPVIEIKNSFPEISIQEQEIEIFRAKTIDSQVEISLPIFTTNSPRCPLKK